MLMYFIYIALFRFPRLTYDSPKWVLRGVKNHKYLHRVAVIIRAGAAACGNISAAVCGIQGR